MGMLGPEEIIASVGEHIKEVRKQRKLTLQKVAEISGISVAMLSKIENGRIHPTFYTLLQILLSLKVDLNEFFANISTTKDLPSYFLIKKQDYRPIQKEASTGFNYELIFKRAIESSTVEFSLLHLDPQAKRKKVTTAGYEFLFLISGEIDYFLQDEKIKLEEGDSLFFDGNIPHVPQNNSEKVCTLLVIYFIPQGVS
jgi:transcriptional regulator with XRE-family HTH domain